MLDVVLVPEGEAVARLYEVISRDRDKPIKVHNIEVCLGGYFEEDSIISQKEPRHCRFVSV